MTENVANFENTPDVGFALTLAWIEPRLATIRREIRRSANGDYAPPLHRLQAVWKGREEQIR